MYKIVEYNGENVLIHSNEFNPNEMKILFIGNYEQCKQFKNN